MNDTSYKYLIFAFDSFESDGGMEDLIFKFNTLDEFLSKFIYKDLYHYQLVNTKDFSYKSFNPSIVYRMETDDYNVIVNQRETEFINWVTEQLE